MRLKRFIGPSQLLILFLFMQACNPLADTPMSQPTFLNPPAAVTLTGTNVTLSLIGVHSVQNGETFSIDVVPEAHYSSSISVGGTCPAGSWAGATYTTGALFADCSLDFSSAIITHSLVYEGNGNTGGALPTEPSSPYAYNSTISVLGNPGGLNKTGHTFAGWNTAANGSGTAYSPAATFAIVSDTTLYAQWTINSYTVVYQGNGNTGGAVPVDPGSPYNYNSTVTVLGNTGALIKTGSAFAGWNTASDGSGTSYVAANTFSIAGNTQLYAMWTLNTYTVTYSGNGNTGGAVPVDLSSPYNHNSTVTVLGNTGALTKTGHSFAGWNTVADGSGTAYAPANTFSITANRTLYAQWTVNTYTVTYNGNGNTGGAVPTDPSSPYNYNSTVTVLGNTGALTKTGYTFTGWNTTADGSGTAYAPAGTFSIAANHTLYAQWAINTYTVTYNGNGNTGGAVPTDPSSPYNHNSTVSVIGNSGALSKTGYTFNDWNTAADGSGTSYAPASTFSITSNRTLYAQWTINSYTVTYDGNGSTGGTVPSDLSSPYTHGSTVTVLGNTGVLVKTNYVFSGWNTAADGSGTSYSVANTFSATANTTLYAIWTPIHTITFNSNGGAGVMAAQSITQGDSAHLTVNGFTKASSSFTGWSTSAAGAIAFNDGQLYTMGNSDVTLYAIWTDTSHLLVHYNFDGQNCNDSSAFANHCTASNISYAADGGGFAASLNGTTSHLILPDNLIRGNANFTIMIRFKAAPGQYGSLFGYQNNTVGSAAMNHVPMLVVRSDGLLRGELWIGSQLQVLSSSAVNDGKWHTAYFSATPGSIALYLDGNLLAGNSGTVQHLDMTKNQIGSSRATGRTLMPLVNPASNTWFYFDGLVDDFYFYDTDL